MTPSSGGTEGGTFLHIHGTGLDDTTDAATQVLVGGVWAVSFQLQQLFSCKCLI